MTPQQQIAFANLLSVLIGMSAQIYGQIQQAHAAELKSLEEVLSVADTNWDAVIAKAQEELAKLKP